jgi:hypothetical protein
LIIGSGVGDNAGLIIGGRLGTGRETGVSAGVGVVAGVCVGIGLNGVVGIGVICGVGVTLLLARRRECRPGLIGRTGSKFWVGALSTEVPGLVSTVALGRGDSLVGDAFFFFRCFGAGVGRTKSFFNLSPNDSSCSCVARARPVLIATVITITNTKRSFVVT